ncbi:SRPBCC family protein [Solitalea koreensis]|uniref:Ligand-binding SRPBCC domain-containing protein n=1 Tax=Solitalea koreensis TaxID=543615 RepID=A0A521DDI9_9SPHI|nr:SRPBCC family protein [Solitalea koreensis]SMO69652.1 Ligand-binding SRPBCC domain-containing protein [Solitalea koreensis]
MKFQLYREQQQSCDIQTAWKFFSNPYNLSKITPKDMGFVVRSEFANEDIHEGMEIDYNVSPFLGIEIKWKTRITQVEFQKSFTDFQEKGPFKYWNHRHEFVPNEKGVFMNDTVDYELPFGFLGTLAHQVLVKNKLEKIFNHRFNALEKMFNDTKKEL